MVGEGGRPREEEEDAGLVNEADAAAPLVDERGMVVWCVVLGQALLRSSLNLMMLKRFGREGGQEVLTCTTCLSSVRACVCGMHLYTWYV